MRKLKRVFALVLSAAVLTATVTGCAQDNKETKVEVSNEIVATIEGVKIPESLYRVYLWSTQQYFEQIGGVGIWDMELDGQKTEDVAKQRALESAILSVVTNKKADEMGIKLSSEQKKAAKANAADFVKRNTEIVETYGFSEKDIEELLLGTEMTSLVEEKLGENFMPSEEDIQKYITEHKGDYDQVTAKHVLLKTTDEQYQPLPEEEQNKKLETANEVLQKALAGDDMSALAKEYSEDQGSIGRQDIPDGEYTFKRNEMVKEFEEAAFNGKDGVVWPELVKTTYGYHIIKTEKHIPADEQAVREDYIARSRRDFTTNEFTTMIENSKVEKTATFDNVKVVRAEIKDNEGAQFPTSEQMQGEEVPQN